LAEHADAIRRLGKRVVGDVSEIGRRLSECKKLVGHGNWLPWLDREFGWTDKTAENFINVHKLAGKFENFSNLELPLSGLYLLAAPSTPQKARDEIIERAEAGEKLPVAEVNRTVEKHKGRKRRARSQRNKLLRANKREYLEIKITGLESEIAELKEQRREPASAARCEICREKKQATQRRVFVCDRCAEIHELETGAEAAPPADDGLDIPACLDRTKRRSTT